MSEDMSSTDFDDALTRCCPMSMYNGLTDVEFFGMTMEDDLRDAFFFSEIRDTKLIKADSKNSRRKETTKCCEPFCSNTALRKRKWCRLHMYLLHHSEICMYLDCFNLVSSRKTMTCDKHFQLYKNKNGNNQKRGSSQ